MTRSPFAYDEWARFDTRWLDDAPHARTELLVTTLDHGRSREALRVALTSELPALDELTVVDLSERDGETFAALASAPALARISTLRLVGRDCPGRMLRVLLEQLVAPRLRVLHLSSFAIAADELAMLAGCAALAELEALGVTGCRIEGSAGISTASFAHVRWFEATRAKLDAAFVAALVARLTELETLVLDGASVGDDAACAIAAADLPRFRRLSMRNTSIRERGILALACSPRLRELASYDGPTRAVSYDKLHAARASGGPSAVLATISLLPLPSPVIDRERAANVAAVVRATTSVDDAIAALRAEQLWPADHVPRRFVARTVTYCRDCGGTGRCPDGPCSWHEETVVGPLHDGPAPRDLDDVIAFASCAAIADAERLGALVHARLAERGLGAAATSVAWFFDEPGWSQYEPMWAGRQASKVAEACGAPRAFGDYWAFEAAAQLAEPSPFGPARELYELGFRLRTLDGAELQLVLPRAVTGT
ncbi:MAG TPA: hypothetical protein VGG74_24860 [Kofleriaceae bacterium]